jgi:hypothetical protein
MKVSLAMLLKTNVEKMSENWSLAMLMKPNELKSLSGDVDEKKGEKRWARGRKSLTIGSRRRAWKRFAGQRRRLTPPHRMPA